MVAAVLAIGITLHLSPRIEPMGDSFLFAAVVISAWYGGLGPGLLATALTTLAANAILTPPIGLVALDAQDILRLASFAAVAAFTSVLSSMLITSREAFRTLLEAAPLAVVALDRRGIVTIWNAEAERLFGWSAAEVVGARTPLLLPDQQEEFRRLLQRAHAGQSATAAEMRLSRRDGTLFPASISVAPVRGPRRDVIRVICLIEDVTLRKQAQEAIEALNAEMREADAAKNRFLAILAHELRNLLSPVLTALQAVRLHAPDDPRIQRSLDVATRSINTQSRLVTDLLDLSRIAQGRMEFEREPVELDDLVTTVAEGQREPMERAGLTLEVQTTPGLRTLGDAGRLQQALLNLLSNATKFTPPGGEVRVTLQREGAEAHIVVADTGIGMDEATMRHAFDLFRQGEAAASTGMGLGIGLALVRSITEHHGGRVWAESEGPGQGSRFTLALPLLAAATTSA
ncbi:MAG: PAS domain S-box protein [Armatimonadetes bacterium]|nr:PAS domain S-box protein [Armatimonadota bacterium]